MTTFEKHLESVKNRWFKATCGWLDSSDMNMLEEGFLEGWNAALMHKNHKKQEEE